MVAARGSEATRRQIKKTEKQVLRLIQSDIQQKKRSTEATAPLEN